MDLLIEFEFDFIFGTDDVVFGNQPDLDQTDTDEPIKELNYLTSRSLSYLNLRDVELSEIIRSGKYSSFCFI